MSRSDIENGVRAGLEAAANVVSCLELLDPSGLSKKEQLRIYDVLGKAEDAIRAIDPAAIAATVPERRGKPCEHHTWEREDAVSADGMCPLCLADELAALRARVAELERK